MGAVLLYGAGSGALHAVTGPDHVLSLGPVALRHPRGSFRIGLMWGVGHGIGTLVLAVPLLVLSGLVDVPLMAAVSVWGEKVAGVALLVAATWSLWPKRQAAAAASDGRGPLWVGLIHGATGASSLLLLMPVLVSGALSRSLLFLLAFAIGSALAMALFTSAIARVGSRLSARVVERTQRGLAIAGGLFGASLLV